MDYPQDMVGPISQRNLERELAHIRGTLARRMENRDPGKLAPAEEVFAELHRRNAAMRRQAE